MTDIAPHAAATAAGDTAAAGTPPAAATTPTPEATPAAAPAATPAPAEGAKPAEGTPAQETKPADGEGTKADDKGTDGKDGQAAKAEGAPEQYQFTVPEGMEGVQIDQKAVEAVTPLFKKYGVTQEDAQAIATLQAQAVADTRTQVIAEQAQVWENNLKQWDEEAAKDPTIGPELEKVQSAVANIIAHYGGKDEGERAALAQYLTSSGIHRHPAILRFGQHVLKNVLDAADTGPVTGAPTNQPKNWFPNSGHVDG